MTRKRGDASITAPVNCGDTTVITASGIAHRRLPIVGWFDGTDNLGLAFQHSMTDSGVSGKMMRTRFIKPQDVMRVV